MAELKLRNELGLNRSLAILEPARRCVAHCTWCYVEINRKGQWGGKTRSDADSGSFERLVERTFGPQYDPTNILQWQLRNKVPFVFATGVEPFQDLPQARSILQIIRQLDLPVFFQTRGTNWREVWDLIEPLAGNAAFYISVPSLDPRYIKRFEPKTPALSEREALIRTCKAAGIPVMAAVAPYHPTWSGDLPGMATTFHEWGATDLFLDVLHLNRTQIETITKQGGDSALIELARTAWTADTPDQWAGAAAVCADRGMGFETVHPQALIHEISSFPAPDPWPFRSAFRWPYTDRPYLDLLEEVHATTDGGPILLDWTTAVAAMEASGRVDQVFSFASMSEFRLVRDLKPAWKESLGQAAPFREYLRALWNEPRPGGFPWHHPFVRMAVKPDGSPYRGETQDLVMVYDPDWPGKALARPFESLDDFPWLQVEE